MNEVVMSGARMLVTYGSHRGGTAELARWVATALRGDGLEVDLLPATEVRDVRPYAGVVVGGSVYAGRWHAAARRLLRRHRGALAERAVWLFSSGPLDNSAREREIPPVHGVARAAERIGARGHATFGGLLDPHTPGVVAGLVAKKAAGDFRDHDQVDAWAAGIAADMRSTVGELAAAHG